MLLVTLDKFVHVGVGHFGARGEHDKVRGIHNLLLIPRMRQQPGAFGGIVDDQEFIRLQTVGCRREHERALQGLPDIGGNFFGRVKYFRGVTPLQCIQQLLSSSIIHSSN